MVPRSQLRLQMDDMHPLAAVTFLTGSFGTLLMLYLMGFVLAKASFRNAFGFFSLSQIVSHLGLLLIILGPVTVEIEWNNLVPDEVAIYVGYFALTFQFTGHYAMCLMTANRFCAVFFPIGYARLFTNRKGLLYVVASWTLALLQCGIYLIDTCTFTFLGVNLHFTFEQTTCGYYASLLQDFAYNGATAIVAFSMDLVTLSKLIHLYKRRNQVGSSTRIDTFSKEKALFAQAMLAALMYLIMLLCFHLGSIFTSDRVRLFWLTTFAWGLYLCLDGLSIFFIYSELRQPLYRVKRLFVPRKAHVSPAEEIHIEIADSQ